MKRRGPYKRYLTDSELPVPKTTRLRRRRLQEAGDSQNPANTSEWGDNTTHSDENEGEKSDSNSEMQVSEGESSSADEESTTADGELLAARGVSPLSVASRSDTDESSSEREDEETDRLGSDPLMEKSERVPLYPGAGISKEESEVLIMTFFIRFGLTDLALERLIELIDCHLPSPQHVSKYHFLKKFPPVATIDEHFYCPKCKKNVTYQDGSDSAICVNPDCEFICDKSSLKREGAYFLHMPLKEQLKNILSNSDISQYLRKNSNQSDVVSGSVYKKLFENEFASENDLTLQWNTDGVNMFDSSKASIWPIQVCINELPFQIRRENIILSGLWYGDKPVMDTFLKPFVSEITSLHEEGLTCHFPNQPEPITIKCHTIICSVDSVARPMLQNIKQFNGKFGCSFCLHPGKRVPIGKGFTRVYLGDKRSLRTFDQHLRDAKKAVLQRRSVKGVKGWSPLIEVPVFNIISSFVPDYMHCVCLGVCKTMMEEWLSSSNKRKSFYIDVNKVKRCNDILLSIKPPSEISRTPRRLEERKMWKASEWKNFLLYYSLVCLVGIGMPKEYVENWFLLVYGINTFLKESISKDDYQKAEASLRKFVMNVERLYSPQLLKFNFHLLLHIPKSVKNFGALWGVSAFMYEHYNGVLVKMFHGSQAVPGQICKNYLRFQAMGKKASDFTNSVQLSLAKKLFENMHFGRFTSKLSLQHGSVRLFGVPKKYSPTLDIKLEIENLLGEEIDTDNVMVYERLIFNNILIHCEGYERMIKRENSFVELVNEKLISVCQVLLVRTKSLNRSSCVIIGQEFDKIDEALSRDTELSITSCDFMAITEKEGQFVAILPEMIKQKCIKMYSSQIDKNCIYPLVNSVERD